MADKLNSTFNSLESHLLSADENIRLQHSRSNFRIEPCLSHQLSMPNVLYSFFNNTRTHLKYFIDDLNSRKEQIQKLSNIQAMAEWALRNSLATKVGRGKYAMTEYEKIKRITFLLDFDHLLLVTTDHRLNI